MKRITTATLITLILAWAPVKAYARTLQEFPSDEISLSYGRVSIPGFAMTFGSVLGAAFSFGLAAPDHIGSTGAIGVEYFHYFNPHVAVGCAGVFEDFHLGWKVYDHKDDDGNNIYRPGNTSHNLFTSLMPAFKWRWLYKEHFSMYSKIGFGGCWQYTPEITTVSTVTDADGSTHNETETTAASSSFTFSAQLSPIGMEFGGDRFKGFTEIGIGMQGLLVLGVRYSL